MNNLREVVILLVTAATTLLLWSEPAWLLSVLVVIGLIQLALQKRTKNVLTSLIIFLVAFVVEITFVNVGVWSYPTGGLMGVPYWIPVGWAIFIIGLKEIYSRK